MNSRSNPKPRIVIHGGAGNISRSNLPAEARKRYLASIATILAKINPLLQNGTLNAVEAAVLAVVHLENDPLFNCGKGAVFTLDGQNELEASLMVSRGQQKRCAGVYLLKHVKNPILLAKELLLRGVQEEERGTKHICLSGEYAEKLAEKWGLDIVDQDYFWTKIRWEQHLRDLKDGEGKTSVDYKALDDDLPAYRENKDDDIAFNPDEYLPKGTVGCVVLDGDGLIAAATSTGGLTNKVPGRIGDTPTPGAGFWAEEFLISDSKPSFSKNILTSCLPLLKSEKFTGPKKTYRAVGLSGTGNGDYFLRLSACHNIVSRCRYSGVSLAEAAKEVVGKGGEMERAGEDRNDYDGAVVGVDDEGNVVMEMNCGGCFRGTVDEKGRVLVAAYADEDLEQWIDFEFWKLLGLNDDE